jgi:hypothetical protein
MGSTQISLIIDLLESQCACGKLFLVTLPLQQYVPMKIICPFCEIWLVAPVYVGRGESIIYCLRCETEEARKLSED